MSHAFTTTLTWSGSTLDPAYPRTGVARNPGGAVVPVSAAPFSGGDAALMNPEELLAAALSTCHMLFFLSLAAKVRLDVKHYEDHAAATLVTENKVSRIEEVVLSPVIRVAPGTSAAKVVEMFEKAHKYCIIANTVNCKVTLKPRVVEG